MGGCLSEKEGRKEVEKTDAKRAGAQLSEGELRVAIDQLFEKYDKDGNNCLDKHEVMELMNKSLGRTNLSEKEAEDFMSKIDANGNKTIEREELFKLYKQLYC
jgi:Ca2+-binding EF-hand superfamily protein